MDARDLYEAIVDEAAHTAMPAMIADLLGARSGFLQEFRAGVLVDARYSYFAPQVFADLLEAHPDGVDVWSGAGLRNLEYNRAAILDDWVPQEIFMASKLHRVFRDHGDDTGHSMAILHEVNGTKLGMSVQRALGQPFERSDAARLDAIAPDLHRIHRARDLLRHRDGAIAGLEMLLESGRTRVLLLGLDLVVIEVSPEARALLNRGDGLSTRAGRLVSDDPNLTEVLRRAVNRTIHRQSVDPAPFACRRPSGAPAWHLLVLPLSGVHAAGCAVVVSGGDLPADRLGLRLERQFNATPAEIDVALGLIQCRTPEQIATGRGVSINTVRTQIRGLLEKTGAGNLAQLSILLAQLA